MSCTALVLVLLHTYCLPQVTHFLAALMVDCVWNAMARAQKQDFVFRRNGRVHLNRRGRQFSRLLAAEVCESAVVMLDTPCSEVVWRALATHSILQFPLHFPSHASPCAITFQLDSTSDAQCYNGREGDRDWRRILWNAKEFPMASLNRME